MADVGGLTYIKLMDGGWIFEREPVKGELVLARMHDVEVGRWWYQQVSNTFVETRRVPTFANDARTGYMTCPDEAVVVCCRCRIDGNKFLRLMDGRGWVFADAPPDIPEDEFDHDFNAVFVECATGQELASCPRDQNAPAFEYGFWKYEILDNPVVVIGRSKNGNLLQPGTTFLCDMRVPASGLKTSEVSSNDAQTIRNRVWLRIADDQGWLPKTDTQNKPLVRFLGVRKRPEGVKPPRAAFSVELNTSDWMVGVA